jgi:NTP pyrophosphatase (non-canonical NTP hydrolase)
MKRITNEQREAIVREAIAKRDTFAASGQQAEPTDEQIEALLHQHTWALNSAPWDACKAFARAVLALAGQQSERRPADKWVRCEFCHQLTDRNRVDPLHPSERPAPAGQAVGERWRPEVIAFADAMESKLRQNDWKGGWKDDSPGQLMERVREEFAEFHTAHLAYPRGTDAYKSNLRDEGADVANMVMMVLDAALAASQAERPAVKEGDKP